MILTLNGAQINSYSFTPAPKRGKGGPMVLINCSAKWTKTAQKAMKWEALPKTVSGSIHLSPGNAPAQSMEMTPKGLEQHTLTLEISGATGFSLFIPTKDDEEEELRFSIETPSKDAGRALDKYCRTVGTAPGIMKLEWDEAKQGELGTKAEGEQGQLEETEA